MKRVRNVRNLFAMPLAALAAACLPAAGGNTLTVAPDGTGDYATVQAAVEAASKGDTIFIRAGVYATGGREDTFATKMMNRVFIDKSLTLVGEDREKTVIKGAHATTAADSVALGLGADACRCIGVAAADVVISNLTVTGGATHTPTGNDNADGCGGGIYAPNTVTGLVIADCNITNNIANRGAGIRFGSDTPNQYSRCLLARCWLDGNRAVNRDPVGRGCIFAHCLITRHFSPGSLFYNSTLVNCTLADGNCRNAGETSGFTAYNCLFADTWYKGDLAGRYYNCTISGMTSGEIGTSAVFDACQTGSDCCGTGYDHFVAPPLLDYRLHDQATHALGRGSASYLDKIPEAFRHTDFYGNAFEPDGDTIAVGCSQVPVTPVGGKLVFDAASFGWIASVGHYGYVGSPTNDYRFGEDARVLAQMKALGYVYADVWPKIVKLRVDLRDGRWPGLFGFQASGADEVWRHAYLDGSFEFCLPRLASQVLTLTPKRAAQVVYVRQASAVTPEDGSADAPYTDLQAAIDALPADYTYSIVYADGGTFASGGSAHGDTQLNRILVPSSKYVHLIGIGGPAHNVIVGQRDTSDAAVGGMGPNGVRCVRLASDGSVVQGFTLTGGSSHYSDSVGTAKRGAGIFLSKGAQVLDCVISNNVARQGAAINAQESGTVTTAYALRCLITANASLFADGSAGGSGLVRATATASCLFHENTGSAYGSYEAIAGHFNTYGESRATNPYLTSTLTLYNCVVRAPDATLNTPRVFGGVVNFGAGAVNAASTGYSTDPVLVADPALCDYRPGTLSPALTTGVWADDDYIYLTRDIAGNPVRTVDGKPVCGAVRALVPTIISAGTGVVPAGTNAVAGATVTFMATAADTRPFLGFCVDGVTQEVAGVTYEYAVPADANAPGDVLAVSPVYDTHWYVDPAGDDSARGTAAHPKRTLKGGLDHAIDGDTVHVAPGVYDTLTMRQTKQLGNNDGAFDHLARAVVPDGVTLEGAGAETTFIVGKADADADASDMGCGPNAVRCVALGANACLRGFTLTGGRTDADGNADNFHGGGVLGYYASGRIPVITDCIISNCVARRGGGAMFGDYNRCRFFDNAVIRSGNGPAMRGNGVNSAFVRNTICDRNCGWATTYGVTAIENCTFGPRNASTGGETNGVTVISGCGNVRNTLFFCDGSIGNSTLYRCAYGPLTRTYLIKDGQVATNDCIEVTRLADLEIDANYAPAVDANVAIDCGDKTLYSSGETDASGNPRFVNGLKLDVGAVEADWLEAYSRAIGRHACVTAADGAVERVAGKVTLPPGATLTATVGLGGEDRTYRLGTTVAADGQCAVTKDGDAWQTLTAGVAETLLTVEGERAELRFAASGLGSTALDYLRSAAGTLLILR